MVHLYLYFAGRRSQVTVQDDRDTANDQIFHFCLVQRLENVLDVHRHPLMVTEMLELDCDRFADCHARTQKPCQERVPGCSRFVLSAMLPVSTMHRLANSTKFAMSI